MIDGDKQALIDNLCTVPTKIIVDNGDGTTTILTESDYVLNWDHEDFRFVPNEGFIGQFVERIVTGNLKNVNDSFSITDKEIEVQFGITTNTQEEYYVKNLTTQDISGMILNTDTTGYTPEEILDGFSDSIGILYFNTVGSSGGEIGAIYGNDITSSFPDVPIKYTNGETVSSLIDNHVYMVILTQIDDEIDIQIMLDLTENEYYGDYILSANITSYQVPQTFGQTVLSNCVKVIGDTVENTNWYSLGHFIVSDPSDDNVKDKTSFKAIDYAKYFETPFEDRLLYPTTVGCLAYSCCSQSKVQLGDFYAELTSDVTIDDTKQYFVYDSDNDIYNYVLVPVVEDIATYYELSFGFNNANLIIEANPFVNNESCREVMKCVGKTAFSWVRIDWDDKCYIDYTKEETVGEYNEVDNDHYYDLTTSGSVFGELNKIVVGIKDIDGENVTIIDEQSVNPDVSELDIWDNPLTYTQEKREEVITVGEQLFGLKYQDIELTTTGHPWLKGKEKIKIKDMEDNYIYTYPFDRTISYNGHIKTKIKAPVISNINTQYTYNNTILNKLRNTQIQVDKANQQIISLVTETQELNDTVTEIGTTYRQSLNEFQYQITQLNDVVTENNENLQEQIDTLENTVPEKLQNTLVSINVNGIQVSTNLSKISTMMTNDTFSIQDSVGTRLAYFGYDENLGRSVSQMDNLTVTNYFTAGYHRQQKFDIDGENRTGWFYIGGV